MRFSLFNSKNYVLAVCEVFATHADALKPADRGVHVIFTGLWSADLATQDL